MCSKRVNGRMKFLQAFRHASVTLRLTVLYTLTSVGLLLVSALFMYKALVANLTHSDSIFVDNEIHLIEHLLREYGGDKAGLQEEVVWEPLSINSNYFIRVSDTPQHVLIATPGMNELFHSTDFPDGQKVDLEKATTEVKASNNRYYLLKAAWISFYNTNENKAYLIQVALDVTHHREIIARYRMSVILILIIGIVIAAALGAFIAHRGMRPLRKMTDVMSRTTISQLGERINFKNWSSEFVTIAQAFNGMMDRLDHSFSRLSQFSADLAHELRTPINNLMGEAEICLARERSPKEYVETLSSSLEECHRLTVLIERMLFLARAENPRTAIERSVINVREELEAIKEFHEAVADDKGVDVSIYGEGACDVDPVLFRRAINNLLSNALKHTQKGDSITLIIAQPGDGTTTITVRDTGSGIPEDHLEHLFNRLYRVDFARSKDVGGTGLGLAIVKSIMDLHEGEVTVRSTLGQGTTFVLSFPKNT